MSECFVKGMPMLTDKPKRVRKPICVMFHVTRYADEIEPRRVVAVTPHFITYLRKYGYTQKLVEDRTARDGHYGSWEEAHDALTRRNQDALESAREEVTRLMLKAGAIAKLAPPVKKSRAPVLPVVDVKVTSCEVTAKRRRMAL